jgi:hypothetical protein
VKTLRLAVCVAIGAAAFLLSGCASRTGTITGILVGSDGHCLYVDVPASNGTERYWLRHLPPGFVEDADGGFAKPDGSVAEIGDSLTVSGTLSSLPFDTQCAGAQTLDATAIE